MNYKLFIILIINFIFLISTISAYTAQNYTNVILVLNTGYSAEPYTSVNLTLGEELLINFVTPTEDNGVYRNRDYIEVNVTSTGAVIDTILIRLYNSAHSQINSSSTSTSPNYINFSGLSDGLYFYNATSNDTSNNLAHTETRTIILDNINPNLTIIYPTNVSYNFTQTELNYTRIDNNLLSSCWYSLDGGATNSTPDTTCSNFTGLDSGQGSSTWKVYANDTAGNLNGTESITFFVDSINPGISFISPTENNNTFFSRTWVFVNVTVTETNEDTTTFLLYNVTGQVNSTSFTDSTRIINWTGLPDGNYTYNVTINDTLNNQNSTETRTITLDNLNPGINYTDNTESNNTFFSRNWIFVNVTITELNFQNITYNLYNTTGLVNSTNYSSQTLNINWTGLIDNNYTYNVTIFDKANNFNTTATRTIILDNINPGINLTFPLNTTYTWPNPDELNYTVSDLNLNTCWYTLNGGLTNTTITCGQNATGLVPDEAASNIWIIYVNDSAGNQNSSNVTFFSESPYIDFNISIATNTLLDFIPDNGTHLAVSAINQTDSIGVFIGSNNLSGTINVTVILNVTHSNFTLKIGNSSNYSLAISVNTSHLVVSPEVTVGTIIELWAWADYNNPLQPWFPELKIQGILT